MIAIRFLCPLFAAGLLLASCQSDDTSDEQRARANRIMFPTVEQNSAAGEMNNDKAAGNPLISIGLPNTKQDQPTIHTIGESPSQPPTPATRPAAPIPPDASIPQPAPSTQPRPAPHVDPITGQPN